MTAYDDQNILAKILRGEIPSFKVYEDDETLASWTLCLVLTGIVW